MAKAPKLGQAVSYRVPSDHHTENTIANHGEEPRTLKGSVHHAALREFAGLVGRVHADGRVDLVIFVPERDLVRWVDDASPDDYSLV